MRIRQLNEKKAKEMSELIWKSAYRAEKEKMSERDLERFRDLISPISLKMNVFCDETLVFGAFEKNDLVGVAAIRTNGELILMYVHPQRLRCGIGSALIRRIEKKAKSSIQVLSSDSGVLFYEKHGFVPSGDRRSENGIFITPMTKEK